MSTQHHILDKQAVEKLIPQRSPFVMIDRMNAFTATTLSAGFHITGENIFSHDDVFTEPGIVEHMAQSVALHTGYQFFLRGMPAPTGYIGAINQLEIIELPHVGDQLTTEVEILQEFGGITMVNISTSCDGRAIASGQMKTVIAA